MSRRLARRGLQRKRGRGKWGEANGEGGKRRRKGPEAGKAQPQRKLGSVGMRRGRCAPQRPSRATARLPRSGSPAQPAASAGSGFPCVARPLSSGCGARADGLGGRTEAGAELRVSPGSSGGRLVCRCWLGLRGEGVKEKQQRAGDRPSLPPPRGGRLWAPAPGPAPGLPSVWPGASARLWETAGFRAGAKPPVFPLPLTDFRPWPRGVSSPLSPTHVLGSF